MARRALLCVAAIALCVSAAAQDTAAPSESEMPDELVEVPAPSPTAADSETGIISTQVTLLALRRPPL